MAESTGMMRMNSRAISIQMPAIPPKPTSPAIPRKPSSPAMIARPTKTSP